MKMQMEEIVFWAQEFGTIIKNNNIDDIVKTAFDIKAKIKKVPKKSGFLNLFKLKIKKLLLKKLIRIEN